MKMIPGGLVVRIGLSSINVIGKTTLVVISTPLVVTATLRGPVL
jgi:hypothetical protein